MSSSIYTLIFNGTPAQLIGILWDNGDTGLAVIRLRGEGRFLRAVHPSKLQPIPPADLRPAAAPQSKCPDGQLPDGPTCPACGRERAPSGVGNGTWVHWGVPNGNQR